ncbi:MAG: class I SAM-dependent methyltransferase [Flavobacteriales bacterium]
MTDNSFDVNRAFWNERTKHHVTSAFYDTEGFVAGRSSLTAKERELLGDVKGKRVLHLQCHFGQDTISLARMGAHATGIDLSDASIAEARKLAERCGQDVTFIEGNVLDLRPELTGMFDIVFTSYGVLGWLPELDGWARNIARYLKPGGRFVLLEFHPVVWMFDNDFERVDYSYFNRETIIEEEEGTYADRSAPIQLPSHAWNHDLGELFTALLGAGLRIERFEELDSSPFNCFNNTVRGEDGLYRIHDLEGKLPMVYALAAVRPS